MGFVLDIILAAVILISPFLGLKQGIVRTAVGFVGGIFALAASAVLSGFAADLFCGMVGQSHAATPLEYNFIRIIAAVVLFVALQLLVFPAGRALDLFFHLPGLNMVNRLLGALFGALKGAVFAVLLCALLTLALPYLKADGEPLPPETLGESRLYGVLYEENPVAQLFAQE
mgnify:FL=1